MSEKRTEVFLHAENGDVAAFKLAVPNETPPAVVVTASGRPFLLALSSERDPRGDWVYVEPSWASATYVKMVVGTTPPADGPNPKAEARRCLCPNGFHVHPACPQHGG